MTTFPYEPGDWESPELTDPVVVLRIERPSLPEHELNLTLGTTAAGVSRALAMLPADDMA